MSHLNEDQGAEPVSPMAGAPSGDSPELEQDSSAAVAIELLGGSTIDQALPEKKKAIPDSVALLALVIAIAGGGLLTMRKMGLGSQSQFASVKIDYELEGAILDGKEQEIIADLRDNEIEQVPLDQVQKNPFQLLSDGHNVADLPIGVPGESPEDAERRRRAEDRKRTIVNVYASLDLNSVLLGSVPVARISGQTVRVGDMVEGLFVVRSITSRSVALEVDGEMYTLSLGE